MTGQWQNRKVLALVMAALTCVAVAASFALAYPTEVSSSTLGAEWQCHRAVVLTTCSRVSHVVPMNTRSHTRAMDIRRV